MDETQIHERPRFSAEKKQDEILEKSLHRAVLSPHLSCLRSVAMLDHLAELCSPDPRLSPVLATGLITLTLSSSAFSTAFFALPTLSPLRSQHVFFEFISIKRNSQELSHFDS